MKFIWVYRMRRLFSGSATGQLVNSAEIETIVPESYGSTIVFKSGKRLLVDHRAEHIAASIEAGRERVQNED